MKNKGYILIVALFVLFCGVLTRVGATQEIPSEAEVLNKDVVLLESRFSTTTPVVGDSFKYFLKFDHQDDVGVHHIEYFTKNGFIIVEQQHLEPQRFKGRVIQQYEYTLRAAQKGQYQFIPIALHYTGPRKNPVAAQAELAQITVMPVVAVQVNTNSPVMLNEALELRLAITERQAATITSLPQIIEAILRVPPPSNEGVQEPNTHTPTPTPQPAMIRFELAQSQNIAPQQTNGQIVEQYQYTLVDPPKQAGEYVIPELTVTYRTSTGEEFQEHTEAASLFVLNPNTGNLAIKTDYRFLIVPMIVVAAMILTGLAVFLYLRYRKSQRQDAAVFDMGLPPGDVAHRELAKIQALKLPAKGEFKVYYSLVSETVRKFLGAEYHFPVIERTTEEVLNEIRRQDMPADVRQKTRHFLQEADIVKFAKYIPTLEESETLMEQALQIVDESVEYHHPKMIIAETEVSTGQIA